MGRTLIRCDLTVTQNNNSIKGRIMAKAAVKNLMFPNQEQEIRAVRPQQRLKGRAGPQWAARYHCPWGILVIVGAQLGMGTQGGREDPAVTNTMETPVSPRPAQQRASSRATEPRRGRGTTVPQLKAVPACPVTTCPCAKSPSRTSTEVTVRAGDKAHTALGSPCPGCQCHCEQEQGTRQLQELGLTWERYMMLRAVNRINSEEQRTEHRRAKVINYQNINQQKNAAREREGVIQRDKKLTLALRKDGIWRHLLQQVPARCSHQLMLTVCCWKEKSPWYFGGSKWQEGSTGSTGGQCWEHTDPRGSWPRVHSTVGEPPHVFQRGYRCFLQEN
ncbi:uncharacterized protein LOC127480401 [Manacus candei]|uniref:uncharacterized protein LOC127480401 n=1 Tax=Manacus candei TaxID=415023 RepID=UPI0022277AE9|nr:uncharacterized protein LOC127480401 [Manacus candei]